MKNNRISSVFAFTLVEALITITIVGLLMAGVLAFYVSNSEYTFLGEEKLLINSDVRNFTNQMMTNARDANYLVLYQSFYPYSTANNAYPYTGTGADSTDVTYDTNHNSVFDAGDELGVGLTGDYLVFVYYTDSFYGFNPADPTTPVPNPKVKRIVAYWVAPNRNFPNEIALYMFDSDNFSGGTAPWPGGPTFPADVPASNAIESLLPPNTLAWAQNSTFKIVLNNIRGLSNQGLAFTNYSTIANTSILMHAIILHGNEAKRVTTTYNFTITPRG